MTDTIIEIRLWCEHQSFEQAVDESIRRPRAFVRRDSWPEGMFAKFRPGGGGSDILWDKVIINENCDVKVIERSLTTISVVDACYSRWQVYFATTA